MSRHRSPHLRQFVEDLFLTFFLAMIFTLAIVGAFIAVPPLIEELVAAVRLLVHNLGGGR